MNTAQRDDLLKETHQAVLGIKGTDDNGMAGDIKEIKLHLEDHSKRLTIVEVKQEERKPSKKAIGGYATLGLGLIATLWKSYFG